MKSRDLSDSPSILSFRMKKARATFSTGMVLLHNLLSNGNAGSGIKHTFINISCLQWWCVAINKSLMEKTNTLPWQNFQDKKDIMKNIPDFQQDFSFSFVMKLSIFPISFKGRTYEHVHFIFLIYCMYIFRILFIML